MRPNIYIGEPQPDLFEEEDTRAWVPLSEIDDPILDYGPRQWLALPHKETDRMLYESSLGLLDFSPDEFEELESHIQDRVLYTEKTKQSLFRKTVEKVQELLGERGFEWEDLDEDWQKEIIRRDPVRKKRIRKLRKHLKDIIDYFEGPADVETLMQLDSEEVDRALDPETVLESAKEAASDEVGALLDRYPEEGVADALATHDVYDGQWQADLYSDYTDPKNWVVYVTIRETPHIDLEVRNGYPGFDIREMDDEEIEIAMEDLSAYWLEPEDIIKLKTKGYRYAGVTPDKKGKWVWNPTVDIHIDQPHWELYADPDWDKVREILQEEYGEGEKQERKKEHGEVIAEFDDGYYLVEIKDTKGLKEESRQLRHCAGVEQHGHPEMLRRGQTRVFSYRKDGKSIFTIEADADLCRIREVKGKHNRIPGFSTIHGTGKFDEEEWLRVDAAITKLTEDAPCIQVDMPRDLTFGVIHVRARMDNPYEEDDEGPPYYAFGKWVE